MLRHLVGVSAISIGLLLSATAFAAPADDGSYLPVTVSSDEPAIAGDVVVKPGDHLWRISSVHLESVFGQPGVPAVLTPYWLQVIAANKDRLRSGDPDLIYPGEIVTLPEIISD